MDAIGILSTLITNIEQINHILLLMKRETFALSPELSWHTVRTPPLLSAIVSPIADGKFKTEEFLIKRSV